MNRHTSRYRVLLTVPSLSRTFGGPAAKARHLADALRRSGNDVDVVGVGEAEWATGLPAAGRFRATPVPRGIAPLREAVAGADVVHVLGYRDPVGTYAILRSGRAVAVLEPCGMVARRGRSGTLKLVVDRTVGRRVLARADAIVATSRIEKREIELAAGPGAALHVRSNGLAPSAGPAAARGEFRSAHGIPPDAPLALAVGRIARIKNLPALVRVLDAVPNLWAAVAGPVERDGTLDDLRRARKALGDRLTLVPTGLWGRAKAEALADADCYVMPSFYESFGTAALEAAAAGLPVAISDRCGASEVLPEGTTRVVPPEDWRALAGAIQELLEPGVRRAARAAAARLREELGWDRVAAEQMAIYDHVTASRGSSPRRRRG